MGYACGQNELGAEAAIQKKIIYEEEAKGEKV